MILAKSLKLCTVCVLSNREIELLNEIHITGVKFQDIIKMPL